MERVQGLSDTIAGQAGILTQLLAEAVEPAIRRLGLTMATFDLLGAVAASSRNPTQAEIAERLGISAPTLSETIRSAVERGLIAQRRSQRDRRANEITLTVSGRAALRDAVAAVQNAERAMVEGVPTKEIESLVHTLRLLNVNLARHLQSDVPKTTKSA